MVVPVVDGGRLPISRLSMSGVKMSAPSADASDTQNWDSPVAGYMKQGQHGLIHCSGAAFNFILCSVFCRPHKMTVFRDPTLNKGAAEAQKGIHIVQVKAQPSAAKQTTNSTSETTTHIRQLHTVRSCVSLTPFPYPPPPLIHLPKQKTKHKQTWYLLRCTAESTSQPQQQKQNHS